jgi:cytoskeleton protein RodZ
LGHDLRFVAETLHIRFIYLEAIEAGRYEELPGAVYVVGFIRSYADFLGLDSEEVARRCKAEIASQSVNTELVFPEPIPESSIPGGAIMLVGVVISFLAYGGWYASTSNDALLIETVSPVPENLDLKNKKMEAEAELESVDTEHAKEPDPILAQSATTKVQDSVELIQESVQSEAKPPLELQSAGTEVDKPITEDSEPTPVQVATDVKPKFKKIEQEETVPKLKPTAVEDIVQKSLVESEPQIQPILPVSAESVQEPTQAQASTSTQLLAETEMITDNKIFGAENKDSKILVRARRNSWIQVRDNKANKLLLTQLLKTGDSYQVPNQSGLVLLTGNAGALEILVDGIPVPDLAPPGTILKNITLDPDKLRQGAAAQ